MLFMDWQPPERAPLMGAIMAVGALPRTDLDRDHLRANSKLAGHSALEAALSAGQTPDQPS